MYAKKTPTVIAKARFSRDMVENLLSVFDHCAVDGVVIVEVADFGLWVPRPGNTGRFFLGETHVPEEFNRSMN